MADSGGPDTGGSGLSIVDARGDTLRLSAPATRIVSLVPSVTETLYRLGAVDLLVARTDYDTLSVVRQLPSVGGGLGPSLEILRALEPDVVITFAGESDPRTSQGLAALGIREFAVRPDGLGDIMPIVRQIGRLSGRESEAQVLVQAIDADLAAVRAAAEGLPELEVVYLLGGSPPLAAGAGTFISDLLELAGARNALGDLVGLYAPVSPEVLRALDLNVILLGEGSSLDPRVAAGRRVAEIPSWVEIPGPAVGEAAWVVVRSLRPGIQGSH